MMCDPCDPEAGGARWRLALAGAAVFLAAACGGPLKTDYEIAKERARAYVAQHPELDDKTKNTILRNEVHSGMTKEQVIAAWGRPIEVNKFAREEEWRFGCVYPHYCTEIDGPRRGLLIGRGLFDRIRYESWVIFEEGRVTRFHR